MALADRCPNEMPTAHDIIGLIPAAGIARRLDKLSQSKEILPVFFGPERAGDAGLARPACHNLLEGFRSAGVTKSVDGVAQRKMEYSCITGPRLCPERRTSIHRD